MGKLFTGIQPATHISSFLLPWMAAENIILCQCVFINDVLGKKYVMLEKAETAEIFSESVS